jgi:FdrA protein
MPKAKMETASTGAAKLLSTQVSVINVGLEGFASELKGLGVPVVHVHWSPPAGGDAKLAALLGKLGV